MISVHEDSNEEHGMCNENTSTTRSYNNENESMRNNRATDTIYQQWAEGYYMPEFAKEDVEEEKEQRRSPSPKRELKYNYNKINRPFLVKERKVLSKQISEETNGMSDFYVYKVDVERWRNLMT